MTEFCAKPGIIFELIDEISRHRALKPHETDMLETIMETDQDHFRWNARLEDQLLVAAKSRGGLTRFANRHGIDRMAVYQKLCRLRKHKNRQTDNQPNKG